MIKLLIRVVVNPVAIWRAALIVSGLSLTGDILDWLIVGAVFGLVNALIKPVIKLLTAPLNILTLACLLLSSTRSC